MNATATTVGSGSSIEDAREVLDRVNALIPTLRARARETEKLRHMHPDNLRELNDAGVFRLLLPRDRGGLEADSETVVEILAQIARGCPSTNWMVTLMATGNYFPALLADEGAEEIFSTPNLRVSGLIAPTGTATPVDGGYSVSGVWSWNTAGIHTNWVFVAALSETDSGPVPVIAFMRTDEVEHVETWDAAGMSGTATNTIKASEVFVPTPRVLSVIDMTNADYADRRYTGNPYFNRPGTMVFSFMTAPAMLGMARGAMDVFVEKLPNRGITYTNYRKAAEAPILHHQLANAQYELAIAEMFMESMRESYDEYLTREPTIPERARFRAWGGQVASHARAAVNQLFEASGASSIQHSADIQRYFRDVNMLNLHALIQPVTANETYGRVLAGLDPNTTMI